MKRLLVFALLACVALLADADAQGYYGMRDVGSFDAVVCSSFVNNATTGGYRLLSVPTGYDLFRMVRIVPVAPSEAQTFTLRFWPSTGDSSGGVETVYLAATVDGEPYNQYFPCNSRKISVAAIAATDDFYVEAYCTRKGSDYGTRTTTGYDMVAQGAYLNSATGTTHKISVATGCKLIRMIRIVPYAPNAALQSPSWTDARSAMRVRIRTRASSSSAASS